MTEGKEFGAIEDAIYGQVSRLWGLLNALEEEVKLCLEALDEHIDNLTNKRADLAADGEVGDGETKASAALADMLLEDTYSKYRALSSFREKLAETVTTLELPIVE